MLKFTLFLVLLPLALNQQVLNKVVLTDDSARCLDGSFGAYYISVGTNPKQVVMYFEGGGWCGDRDLSSTIQNCYQRSKMDLGSSNSYPSSIAFSEGMLSNNTQNSFASSTKIFLKYCDGSGHQGSKNAPISYKGTSLYFRGHNITISQFESLEAKYQIFSQSEQIIVTGGSAGGLAAFMWTDYVKAKAPSSNVFCIPDSGIFLDSQTFDTKISTYSNQFQNLYRIANAEIQPPVPECIKNNKDAPYKCMMVQYHGTYIKTPIFIVQSLYDSWSIQNILNIHCFDGASLAKCTDDQRDYIEQYYENTTSVINKLVSQNGNGAWGVSCVQHCFVHFDAYYAQKWQIPMKSGNTISKVVNDWIKGVDIAHTYVDNQPWPINKPCSGRPLLIRQ